jgi:hypothetical protein|uniref:Uncharacterized protein n=1 Tax=Podoviridae sp. ct9f93 TaxID=2826544 RepID=A0A8S5NDM8_9CAUD|nr:MAG TPA: hypothetical protein [Podoviridae sp. ct9f93]
MMGREKPLIGFTGVEVLFDIFSNNVSAMIHDM